MTAPQYSLWHGDNREMLAETEDNSVDAVVTDPPYELGFMGKGWDNSGIAFDVAFWKGVLRVLKPGAHLVCFGAPRLYHRLAVAVEDAGFELRDSLIWLFGTGFPKSQNIGLAIDKQGGRERTEVLGLKPGHESFAGRDNMKGFREGNFSQEGGFSRPWMHDPSKIASSHMRMAPVTIEAKQWDGWGTALKPAYEPIILARKPCSEPTVAANVLKWGTGGINVDVCRVETADNLNGGAYAKEGGRSESASLRAGGGMNVPGKTTGKDFVQPVGRFPANVLHDGSDEVLAAFPSGKTKSTGGKGAASGLVDNPAIYGAFSGNNKGVSAGGYGDEGTVARFFYCAKASKSERDGSRHPTVKPIALMRWLCRLITPPNGTIFDPFAGSGTTGEAAILEGFNVVLAEKEDEYVADIERRMARAVKA